MVSASNRIPDAGLDLNGVSSVLSGQPGPAADSSPAGAASPGAPSDILYLAEPGDPGTIQATDINQGEIGDCWALAAVAELALFHPAAITQMIHANNDGSYTVSLYAGSGGKLPGYNDPGADLVQVLETVSPSDFLPVGVNSQTGSTTVGSQTEIWPQVIESALAKLNGGFSVIDQGGWPSAAMEELTDDKASHPLVKSLTATVLQADLAAGDLVTLDTPDAEDPAGLVTDHAYALKGVTTLSGVAYAELYNPWGTDQPAPVAISALAQDFSASDVGTFTTSRISAAPPVLAYQEGDQRLASGTRFSFSMPLGSYQDPAGGSISYSVTALDGSGLPGWMAYNTQSGVFSGVTPYESTIQAIKVVATSSEGQQSAEAFHVYVSVMAPLFEVQEGDIRTPVRGAFSFELPGGSFAAPSGQTLSYTASQPGGSALPSWLSFNPLSGTFSGISPSSVGVQGVVVTATASGGGQAAEAFHIYSTAPAPVLQGDIRTSAGSDLAFGLPSNSYADPAGGTLSYAASSPDGSALPSWLRFDPASGAFSGVTPDGSTATPVMVTATSSEGTVSAEAFKIYAVPQSPVFVAQAPDQRLQEDKAFSFSLPGPSYLDPQGGAVSLHASSVDGTPLPSWMAFNASTDVFSGTTPAGTGVQGIRIDASTTSGGASAEAFHVYIA